MKPLKSPQIIILMGVSGSGKTTVGRLLAKRLGWVFQDADDFHAMDMREKMRRGEALNDQDRAPWLRSLREAILSWIEAEIPTVLACSALKSIYRKQLSLPEKRIYWVYLQGNPALILERCLQRQHQNPSHFMNISLIESQMETLEPPEDALYVDISQSPLDIVQKICEQLSL